MALNRSDFQRLAELRVAEAKSLLDQGRYEGAYYLAGYAVECAIKAYVARQTNQYDFPDRDLVAKVYKHDPEELVRGAGLEIALRKEIESDAEFANNWAVVNPDFSRRLR